jgi:hypothetical protein
VRTYAAVMPFPYQVGIGRLRGLGSTAPASAQIESSVASSLNAAAAKAPPPINYILAGASVVASLLEALGVGSGCGSTCVQATSIVNQAEPAFLANLQAYENGQIDQATAIANYNNLWQAIEVSCSAVPGSAGQKCVSDRQEGACTWKATGTPPTPYSPAVGSCWNWYNAYYVPLTYPPINAPAATPTGTTGASTGTTVASSLSSALAGIPSSAFLIGGGLLVALALFGGNN